MFHLVSVYINPCQESPFVMNKSYEELNEMFMKGMEIEFLHKYEEEHYDMMCCIDNGVGCDYSDC